MFALASTHTACNVPAEELPSVRILTAIMLGAALASACAAEPPPPVRTLAPNAPMPVRAAPDPLPQPTPPPAPSPPAPAPAVAATPQSYPFEQPLPGPHLAPSAPAMLSANLSPARCNARRRAAGLAVAPAHIAAPGVATPLRITGRIGGVRFVTPRAPSPYGVLDCRLALALGELATVLARHGVIAVYVDNFYRPHAHLPGKRKASQHAYGLAVDLMGVTLSDGTTLRVADDWHGAIGRPTCGPGSAPTPATPGALALREIVCDVARAGIFHHMLTPDFNPAHHSHFHFDIARGVDYRVVE